MEGAVDIIYNTLKEAGLYWDEGSDIGGLVVALCPERAHVHVQKIRGTASGKRSCLLLFL